jgi:hypothetical protein
MQDAVSLIGKIVSIGELNYTIVKVFFVPDAVSEYHDLYFGLQKADNVTINYSYKALLPYFKKQIKL